MKVFAAHRFTDVFFLCAVICVCVPSIMASAMLTHFVTYVAAAAFTPSHATVKTPSDAVSDHCVGPLYCWLHGGYSGICSKLRWVNWSLI